MSRIYLSFIVLLISVQPISASDEVLMLSCDLTEVYNMQDGSSNSYNEQVSIKADMLFGYMLNNIFIENAGNCNGFFNENEIFINCKRVLETSDKDIELNRKYKISRLDGSITESFTTMNEEVGFIHFGKCNKAQKLF